MIGYIGVVWHTDKARDQKEKGGGPILLIVLEEQEWEQLGDGGSALKAVAFSELSRQMQ